jgi:beta-glucosidase
VDGIPASQNHALLNGTLKHDWRFRGFVISDEAAVGGAVLLHRTEASIAAAAKHALEAGLDVIFQASYEQYRPYIAAVRSGSIPMSVIDSAVARVLRAKIQLGLFEHPYTAVDSAAAWQDHARGRVLARTAAHESIVLLKNDAGTLPLSRSVASVALIGTDADEARLGGYTLDSVRGVSILVALRARLGDRARYAPGPGRARDDYAVIPPQYFDSLSRPVLCGHLALGRATRHASRSQHRFSLDLQPTRAWYCHGLVLCALDWARSRAGERCATHRHRGQ